MSRDVNASILGAALIGVVAYFATGHDVAATFVIVGGAWLISYAGMKGVLVV